jgi:PiT family inorganic phosphate transporter
VNSLLNDVADAAHRISEVRASRILALAACLVAVGSALFFLPRSADLALLAVLLLILGAEFVNGWTDAPNAIATVVGTRSLPPRAALAMAAVFNLAGVMSGTAVATTIGTGIIDPSAVNLTTVGGAMIGIIIWSSLAARWGIPTSESHALVAGLAGGGMASAGPAVLVWAG